MHFFLSLGIPLHTKKMIYELKDDGLSLSEDILNVYCLVVDFVRNNDEEHYINAFQAYLNLLIKLNITSSEALNAYKAKLDINYQRQEQSY